MKKNKYRNKKVTTPNGLKFDSIKELNRWNVLLDMQKKHEIVELNRQIPFQIVINKQKVCKYIADFTYFKDGKLIVEDVKSNYTKKLSYYRLKKKLLKAVLDIDILET